MAAIRQLMCKVGLTANARSGGSMGREWTTMLDTPVKESYQAAGDGNP